MKQLGHHESSEPVILPAELLRGLQEAKKRLLEAKYPITTEFGRYSRLWDYMAVNPGFWGKAGNPDVLEVGPGASMEVNMGGFPEHYPNVKAALENAAPGIFTFHRSSEPIEIHSASRAAGKNIRLTIADANPDILYIAEHQPYILAGDGPPFMNTMPSAEERSALRRHYSRVLKDADKTIPLQDVVTAMRRENIEFMQAENVSIVFPSNEYRNSVSFKKADIIEDTTDFSGLDLLISLGDVGIENLERMCEFASKALKVGGHWITNRGEAKGFEREVDIGDVTILRKK